MIEINKGLIGKRILFHRPWSLLGTLPYQAQVREAKVVELSPSVQYIKLKYPNGREEWESIDDIIIQEILEG